MHTQPCRLIHLEMTTPQTSVPNTRTSVWNASRRGTRRTPISVSAQCGDIAELHTPHPTYPVHEH